MRVDIHTTTQKYRVIYADPPWKFSSKEATGKNRGVKTSIYKPLEAVYPTMTTADLKALDVGRLAEKDAALFMWATDAHLPDALELFKAWGFRYVTVAFVWAKKTVTGKTVANLAPWTLKNCELCLMGTRGHMVQHKKQNNVQQLVEAVRTRHSEKPEEVRQRIEALFGDAPGSSSLPAAIPPGGTCGEMRCNYDSSTDRAQARLHPYPMGDREVARAPPLGRRPSLGRLPGDGQGEHEEALAGRDQ